MDARCRASLGDAAADRAEQEIGAGVAVDVPGEVVGRRRTRLVLGLRIEGDERDPPARFRRQPLRAGVIDEDLETTEGEHVETAVAVVVGAVEGGPAHVLDQPFPLRLREVGHPRLIDRRHRELDCAHRAGREVDEPPPAQRRDERAGWTEIVPVVDHRQPCELPRARGHGDAARDRDHARRVVAREGFDAQPIDRGHHELRTRSPAHGGDIHDGHVVGHRSLDDPWVAGDEGGSARHPGDPLLLVRGAPHAVQHQQIACSMGATGGVDHPDLVDPAVDVVQLGREGRPIDGGGRGGGEDGEHDEQEGRHGWEGRRRALRCRPVARLHVRSTHPPEPGSALKSAW